MAEAMPNAQSYLELHPLFILSDELLFANPLMSSFSYIYLATSMIICGFLVTVQPSETSS